MIPTYYNHGGITIYNADCRDVLSQLGRFDLLLTDPPYGIKKDRTIAKNSGKINGFMKVLNKTYKATGWDDEPISDEFFALIREHCAKQVIFGGNYYSFPPSSCWLVWDKENSGYFADAELVWTNLPGPVRLKRHLWNGMMKKHPEPRWHPTQKPLEIISWCIALAGPDVATILDPFAGAGTTGRAAKDLGKRAVLIEREEEWCEVAATRMEQEVLALA